jgi:hypothetical protein
MIIKYDKDLVEADGVHWVDALNNLLKYVNDLYIQVRTLRSRMSELEEEESVKLSPCPLCGGPAELIGETEFYIRCKACNLATRVFDEKGVVVSLWENRT